MTDLLAGCGNSRVRKIDWMDRGWRDLVTIDHDPDCGADVLHDLDVTPWPFDDDTFDEVHAYEVLEHLGAQGDAASFFAHFGEIWRILKPGGMLLATVPAWDNVWAWADPSHRRIITAETLVFLSQAEYQQQVGKTAMTDFRWIWRGDFEIEAVLQQGGRLHFALKAHKPIRGRYGET